MRKDIIGFSQRQKICDMNLSRALDTAYWEKKIKELEERKDELMHEKQVKEYDLDDLGQRKLNSELMKAAHFEKMLERQSRRLNWPR